VDLEAQIDIIWDPATDPQLARADYLNQITHTSDAWLSRPEWNARSRLVLEQAAKDDPELVVPPPLAKDDAITLGFDGSRRRNKGVTDATALVACRLSDGYIEPIHIWEQPDGPAGDEWRVPVDEVSAEVTRAFRTYHVVGFYADPAKWEGHVAQWEATWGADLTVKATRSNPIEWWMGGVRMRQVTQALEQFKDAVLDGELTHSGDAALTRHVVNARKRTNRSGYGIYKDYPDSPLKIDAAVASVLAWQARLDAVSQGAKPKVKRTLRRIY
jgi:hypothetical protein